MDIKIGIRDRRNPGWYSVDNEIYDIPMSCEALAVYNAIARFANNATEKAYFSGKKWKKHHKVGNGKLSHGLRELLNHGLIRPTGEKTSVGAPYYELCNIDHIKKTLFQGGTGRGSEVEQGAVPRRNTNKTKTDKQDFNMLPQPFKESKPKKAKSKIINHYPEIEPLLNILSENGVKLSTLSNNLKAMMFNACESHGMQFCKDALRGRLLQSKQNGTPLYLSTFFDPEKGEWMGDCAKLATAPTVKAGEAAAGEMFKTHKPATSDDVANLERALAG